VAATLTLHLRLKSSSFCHLICGDAWRLVPSSRPSRAHHAVLGKQRFPGSPANGGYFKEFIFFHKTSKTLIVADTIINIELDKVAEPWRTATKFTGMYHPYGQIFFGMRLPLLLQRQRAKAAIAKINSWQPQRILLSQGRCFDADADKVTRRIFGEPLH